MEARTFPNPKHDARYRKVIAARGITNAQGQSAERTVRVACYNPRADAQHCSITLGIGTQDPASRSKLVVELTREVWAEISEAVEEAFKAAD